MKFGNAEFDGIYTESSVFPEDARGRIPPDCWHALDRGNEGFFEGLRVVQPKSYHALVHDCGPMQLLETVTVSTSLSNFGNKEFNYRWGLQCPGGLVLGYIPTRSHDDPLNQMISKGKSGVLKKAFEPYYTQPLDGLTLWPPESEWGAGFDLPNNSTFWERLEDYAETHDIERDFLEKITREQAGCDLRVWIRGSRGELFLIDVVSHEGSVFCVKDHAFDDYFTLSNAVTVLDAYFANSILGLPSTL